MSRYAGVYSVHMYTIGRSIAERCTPDKASRQRLREGTLSGRGVVPPGCSVPPGLLLVPGVGIMTVRVAAMGVIVAGIIVARLADGMRTV
jgi:hypothetical protein